MAKNLLLTYDVKSKQAEVKQALKDKGYMDNWTVNNQIYYLPNTTLWKPETEPSVAIQDIKSVTQRLNVDLSRSVAVNFTTWDGIPGEPHK